jgi:hypothetical protein
VWATKVLSGSGDDNGLEWSGAEKLELVLRPDGG